MASLECKAMHEENFLSSWLREDGEDKKEGHMEADRETKEEMSKQRTREEEKEENETVIVKRRCVNPVSTEVFDIFGQEEDSETCGNSWCDLWDDSCGLSDCDSVTWTSLPVVSVVFVSPSSAVAEICEGVSSGSDWEFVEPQSFSFSKKCSFVCVENQGEMSYEGTPVKAPPRTRRRMMPPTPQQNSNSSTDESHWQADLEAQQSIWSTRERTVIAGMENYLDKR